MRYAMYPESHAAHESHDPWRVPPAEYPAPEVTSREGVQGPTKRAVESLQKAAEAHGWTVAVTYSRGCFPHATTGRSGAVKNVLAVRMCRIGRQAVAVYSGGPTWSWGTLAAWQLPPVGLPTFYDSITQFIDEVVTG